MSEPTRYRVANNQAQLTLGGNILAVDPTGPLVEYADYARLKAEVERLDTLCKQLGKQHSDISCENIRLRKAGDFMQKSMLECGPNEMADAFHHDDWWASYNGWTIAKSHQP